MNTIHLTIPQSPDAILIEAHGVTMRSDFRPPSCRPAPPDAEVWLHRDRQVREMTLAGRRGQVTEDAFSAAGFRLLRQVWQEEGGTSVAMRQRLTNQQHEELRLDALWPLSAGGAEGLLLDGRTAGEWEVVAQARFKNGVPTAVRPGHWDEDYAQAVSLTGEQGDVPVGADGKRTSFEMDPYGVLRPLGADDGPCLLIGLLSQTGHHARLVLSTDERRTALESLVAECEFDGCLVPRGGERTSQWVYLAVGPDPNALAHDLADRVGVYHHVAPPATRPPSVLCTWYYYGPYFTEADLQEDLGYLEHDRLPFDVFLIDECWDMRWGDWQPGPNWPSGMKDAAQRIRALGYRPGIWTCPYLAKNDSELAVTHPEWLLRHRDGSLIIFPMDGPNYVLDPTYPGVCDYIEATFRRLTEDWGFTYHKLDFLRAVTINRQAAFYDRSATRLEAYRRGLEAVRRGIGKDAYLSVCGGHFGGSLGLADSQRSGSDVTAMWSQPPALPKLKQNIHRTWMSRLWHVDPDAMMVRRREQPIMNNRHGRLSQGMLTDDEARTVTVNQYVGGGMVCFMEKFLELDADRQALYRHVIPSIDSPSVSLDYFAPTCPSVLRTFVRPAGEGLAPWVTVAVCNWDDAPRERSLTLSGDVLDRLPGERYLVYEFFGQRLLGVYGAGGTVPLGELPAHGTALVKVLPWDGRTPTFLATDLHFSMGGVEVARCEVSERAVRGQITTRWQYPVRVTVAFAMGDSVALAHADVAAGEDGFEVARPAG
ncbi:MAG: alpha-galactosidase [Chloroflexi bacterium]|nr:alpha-galactosidase [Chloroflexota bacterium]